MTIKPGGTTWVIWMIFYIGTKGVLCDCKSFKNYLRIWINGNKINILANYLTLIDWVLEDDKNIFFGLWLESIDAIMIFRKWIEFIYRYEQMMNHNLVWQFLWAQRKQQIMILLNNYKNDSCLRLLSKVTINWLSMIQLMEMMIQRCMIDG